MPLAGLEKYVKPPPLAGLDKYVQPVGDESYFSSPEDPPPLTRPRRVTDEQEFKNWYAPIAAQHGLDPDPDNPEHHYDYRAAFRAGASPDSSGHWPSQFKTKDHPNRFVEQDGVTIDSITGEPASELTRPRLVGVEKYLKPAAPERILSHAAPVPELPETINSQMTAMLDGRRDAVLITPGEETPAVPQGFVTTKTVKGAFIHDPKQHSRSRVRQLAKTDREGELLGHVEPKSLKTTQAIVARDPQTGVEQQASYVSPENVTAQAEKMREQFPGTLVEAGGAETESRVLAERAALAPRPVAVADIPISDTLPAPVDEKPRLVGLEKYVKPVKQSESVISRVNEDADFSDEQPAPELPAQGVKAFVPVKFPLPSDKRERESMTPEQLQRRAVFEWADREGIPADYVEQFVAREKTSGGLKPAPYRLDDPRRAITTAELLNSPDYDAQSGSLTLHVEPALLDRLKESYHTTGKGYAQRILDDYADPNKKPGEVFYDAVAPPARVLGRGAELASRPLQAASTGLNALTRAQAAPVLKLAGVEDRGPVETLKGAPGAVWDELRTGKTREGYENPAGEVVDKLAGPTLEKINPNLRPLAKGIADIVGDPLMIAGGASMLGRAGKAARGLQLAEDAATIDARMAAIASRVESSFGVRPTLTRLRGGGISVEAVVDGEPLRMTIPPGGMPAPAPVVPPVGRAARALSASPRQVGAAALDVWNATRSVKTSFDLSAPRNSLILTLTRPVHAAKAFAAQVKALRSEDAAANLMRVIDTDAVRPIADRAGLQLTRLDGSMAEREEMFRSAIAEKIPGVRASERAFHTYLNQLRFSTFKDYAVSHPAASAEDLKGVARSINYFTGRGSFGPLENKRVVQGLSAAFYAPRLSVSYVQSLASPMMGTAAAKKFAARHVAQFVATGLAVGGLVKATRRQTGIDFQGDPRSSDFGHIIVGRHRVNLFGGFSALARYTAQALTGERKTESGEVRAASRTDTLRNYGRTRLHPSLGFIIDLKTGKTLDGRELYDAQGKLKKGAALRDGLMPMSAGDITDAVEASGLKGALFAPLAISGADVQTRRLSVPKPATEAQKKYLRSLVTRGGALPPQLTGKRVDDLTLDEASKLIDELTKQQRQQRRRQR